MVRTRVLYADGHVQTEDGIECARRAPAGATVWVDLVATTEIGLAVLPPEWRFHPLALEDCIHDQRRAKYERFPGHDFLVLQALDQSTDADLDTQPVRVFYRPGLVVTVRQAPCAAIDVVARLCTEDPDRVGGGADRLLHALLDAIVDEFMPLLHTWEEALDGIEDQMEEHPEQPQIERLVQVRRRLLVTLRQMAPLQEIVRRLMDGPDTIESSRVYFRDVLDHIEAINDTVHLLKEVCDGIMRLHMERSNERLNRVMKYLAIVSTLLLPMTVISGVFGMNFDVIPTQHDRFGFWSAVALMVASAAGLLGWFRRKGWM